MALSVNARILASRKEAYNCVWPGWFERQVSYITRLVPPDSTNSERGETIWKVLNLEFLEDSKKQHILQQNPERSERILMNVLVRFKTLHACLVSHGDMHFGNVLVDDKDSVSFVDFTRTEVWRDRSKECLDEQWRDVNMIFGYMARFAWTQKCYKAWLEYLNSLVWHPTNETNPISKKRKTF